MTFSLHVETESRFSRDHAIGKSWNRFKFLVSSIFNEFFQNVIHKSGQTPRKAEFNNRVTKNIEWIIIITSHKYNEQLCNCPKYKYLTKIVMYVSLRLKSNFALFPTALNFFFYRHILECCVYIDKAAKFITASSWEILRESSNLWSLSRLITSFGVNTASTCVSTYNLRYHFVR